MAEDSKEVKAADIFKDAPQQVFVPPLSPEEIPAPPLTPPPNESPVPYRFGNQSANEVDAALVQLVNLNSDNILHEPTCIICSSPQRKDIETKWFETKSHNEVKACFKTLSSYRLSNDIIDNHMRFHFDRGISELQKVEYINKIKRLNSVELTTLDRIRLALSAIDERIIGINSIVPNTDLSAAEVEKIKSAEVSRLMASYNNLLKLKSSIMGEMVNQGDLIIIPKKSFVEVFNRAITESKSEDEKNSIMKLLTNLSELNRKTQ